MRISDWSSDVCSSDLGTQVVPGAGCCGAINFHLDAQEAALTQVRANIDAWLPLLDSGQAEAIVMNASGCGGMVKEYAHHLRHDADYVAKALRVRSEEHTSELQSLMRISYAVFCLKKKNKQQKTQQ